MRHTENYLYYPYQGTDVTEKSILHETSYIIKLHRELFYLWAFIAQEGYWDEASEFLESHRDQPTPFEI